MHDLNNVRKSEHIQIINSREEIDRDKNYFDNIILKHRALPEINLQDIDTGIEFMRKKLSFPLLISSMTGGDNELVAKINRNCALAAQETGVAMGVGSQRVMFSSPGARDSFAIRRYAPDALLFANLGAVQLNYGFGLDECREAVQAVAADALYLHLNPLQEAIQPEGNVDFSGLAGKIGKVAEQLSCPVIIKEVGAGIADDDVELLMQNNIHYIDVAGAGGTSWSLIEEYRSNNNYGLGTQFQDWGIPTPLALTMLEKFRQRITVIASGGIRSGVDMARAVILGASLCGIAKPFLKPAMESAEAVISVIEKLKQEFKVAMFLTGVKNVKSMQYNKNLILKWDECL